MPRVVYYTRPAFLDHSLPLLRALAPHASVHLLLELSPEERRAGLFGEERIVAGAGVQPADGAVRAGYLADAHQFLSNLASFDFVVHNAPRAFAPSALATTGAAALRVRSLQPDIVHFEDLTARSTPLLFLLAGMPKLVAIHDARTHLGERVGRAERIRRIGVRRAQRLLFYSRFSQQQFARPGSTPPSTVIPLGPKLVWSELGGPAHAECERSVLFFGRVSAYKGLDVLYSALPSIAEQVPGLRVVVAGSPGPGFIPPPKPTLPEGGSLETYFERIDAPTLRRLFQQASIVVLPYVEASQSGVVQTAFAFHTPVVASAVGGLPEDVDDNVTGLLVPPRDPPALAHAISRLLLDRQLHERMVDRIRDQVRSAWPSAAEQVAEQYRCLLAAR
ncbi:MAG TPA: glycosyltransferase family 4 protein [Chloroflexota bacterium]|jgi:glycosyltransferase involved in cell wall biosynthesis